MDTLTYRNNANSMIFSNSRIEVKNVLLQACRTYGSKSLNETFLSLENTNIKIKVKVFKAEPIEFEIGPNATVHTLKERVYDAVGVAVPNQRLIFNGKQVDNNISTINKFSIKNNSLIEVIPKFRDSIKIHVVNDKLEIDVELTLDCKTKYVKQYIEFKAKIPFKEQILIYQGDKLDNNQPLSYYKLFNNAFVYLVRKN